MNSIAYRLSSIKLVSVLIVLMKKASCYKSFNIVREAIGYVTLNDKIKALEKEILRERDLKIEEARQRRKKKRQRERTLPGKPIMTSDQ